MERQRLVGPGLGDELASVCALAVSGSGNLYAGGDFTTAGGVGANHIAKWNGSAWSALGLGDGSGIGVCALAVASGNLYAGGDFTTAGGVPRQPHRQMERQRLVGPGLGDERLLSMPWR